MEVTVDWPTVLARHDPIWRVGGAAPLVCSNVSGLRMLPAMYSNESAGPGHTCSDGSSDQQCLDELEAQCFQQNVCTDDPTTTGCFGVDPAWHNNRTSQLFRSVASLGHHPGWNVYIPDPELPKRQACVPSTVGAPFDQWEDGPFFGNGLVGGLFLYTKSGSNSSETIAMQIGRVDVWDQRKPSSEGYYHGGDLFNKERLPIGQFEMTLPAGAKTEWRTRLHDAEVAAQIALPGGAGNLSVRALAPHTEAAALVLEVNASSAALLQRLVNPSTDADCTVTQFRFVPAKSESMRGPPADYKPNPPPVCSQACAGSCGGRTDICSSGCFPSVAGGIAVVSNALLAGGDTATAFKWEVHPSAPTSARLFVSIAIDAPRSTSGATAAATVAQLAAADFNTILSAHRAAWSSFWSDFAFISVAQPGADAQFRSTVLEGFYWLQQYKLGSAVRKDGPALDLAGPWLEPSGWLYYWMDLNEQLQYWPLYAAGRFDLARTLESLLTRNTQQLRQVHSPKLTVAFSQSSYILMTYRVVGARTWPWKIATILWQSAARAQPTFPALHTALQRVAKSPLWATLAGR